VAVLVGADRHLSGRLAERRLNATVHLLDDGFQHLGLARDVDLLVTSEEDLSDKLLPAGRLREGLEAARSADAVLVTAADAEAAARVAEQLGVETAFRVVRSIGAPRTIAGDPAPVPGGTPVLLVAGIACPERFFTDATAAGWAVAGTLAFHDHHRFTSRDIDRIADTARAAGVRTVLTTEKDAVRLNGPLPADLQIRTLPLTVAVDPADSFGEWLLTRIRPRRA
jgi:tetraacyldisaccharide 4'-kinase